MSGILYIIIATSLWALDTLIRYPLLFGGASAEQIVFGEHLILTVIFIPILLKDFKRIWNARVSHIFSFVVIGGIGSALSTLAFTRAFTLINPSLVILLQKLQPLVAILLARIILKEPIHQKFIGWALLCLFGGFLISSKDILPGLSHLDWSMKMLSDKHLMGYGLTLLAVAGWGASTVFGKKLSSEGYKVQEIMGLRFAFGLVFLLTTLTSVEGVFSIGRDVWPKIGLMVLLSGLLGMFFYYQGLKKIPARLATLAEMFFPFCALTLNWVFLEATLEPIQLIGGALLILGSTVIQLKHY
ncbi:MAG: EamA family transporter [Bdellovibrio sp. CG12_big_fil_rev_8_21_14_0_65_39_13]|nr:MAG: EamA family transporter [Bdellovibrio sp. CG22_combo_CG10-13_8_21_14_all_39_27]PIQ58246.1 MAG: EamA family transporter [Bdellovibrio sp. CG12_big_fil_rev_8_21_14_0_65_39_13]PIR36655.1 MAG: EamA family transporter [Bdellovibrio sp. CG11_big_fil_rev_8_21_14_0_20_39_38]PJB53375.1 MAG: EamA family transporter [Bdellovibrio sp. CG_4_9_14_3_um_filter_39_7]